MKKILFTGVLFIICFFQSESQNYLIKSFQKISNLQGNLGDTIPKYSTFGISVASLSDLDGDSISELAAGSIEDDGGAYRGAVRILFPCSDGKVKKSVTISSTQDGFTGQLDNGDYFSCALAGIGAHGIRTGKHPPVHTEPVPVSYGRDCYFNSSYQCNYHKISD